MPQKLRKSLTISMIAIKMAEVMVDDLVNGLMEAKMMITRKRMRLEVVLRTKGETIQIISMIRIIEIKEEEGKELQEEASMEKFSTIMKKGIKYLNVLSTKEGLIEEIKAKPKWHMLMKMANHHIQKIWKEKF